MEIKFVLCYDNIEKEFVVAVPPRISSIELEEKIYRCGKIYSIQNNLNSNFSFRYKRLGKWIDSQWYK